MGVIIFLFENIVELFFYLLAAAGVLFALNFKPEENVLAKLSPIFKIVLFIILTSMTFGALGYIYSDVLQIGRIFDDYGDVEPNVRYIISCLRGLLVFVIIAVGGFLSFRGLEFGGGEADEESED